MTFLILDLTLLTADVLFCIFVTMNVLILQRLCAIDVVACLRCFALLDAKQIGNVL